MSQAPKILGIVGSYRTGGYCEQLAGAALELAAARGAATRCLRLADYDIGMCTNCRGCTQSPGTSPVPCVVHHDAMPELLAHIAAADALVIAAPVNSGNLNALTQRFLERCVGFYYWPWDARGGPVLRDRFPRKRALVVSTSAAPRLLNNRVFGFGAGHGLQRLARTLGSRTVKTLKVGLVTGPEPRPTPGDLRRVKRSAAHLLG